MTSSITKKQSKKTKQNKKKERERNKIKYFTIGYERNTQKNPLIHHLFTHSIYIGYEFEKS